MRALTMTSVEGEDARTEGRAHQMMRRTQWTGQPGTVLPKYQVCK